jgi:hypothetical protein
LAEVYLHGTILDDGGLVCEGCFEWGTTVLMGFYTPWQTGLYTGYGFQQRLLGLSSGTTIYFRAVARNAAGTTIGTTRTFTTLHQIPIVATMAATSVGIHQASLNYLVGDSSGAYCEVWMEYGMTIAYGQKTRKVSSQVSGDSGGIIVNDLAAGKPFHFRAVAQSLYGVGYGVDMTLNTLEELHPMSGVSMELVLLLEEN